MKIEFIDQRNEEGKNKNIKKVILTDSQIITLDENNEKNIYSLNKQSSVNVKVGDTVYSYCEQFGRVLPYFVEQIIIDYDSDTGEYWIFNASCVENDKLLDYIDFSIGEIGETVFLTEEDAKNNKLNEEKLKQNER